MSIGLTPEEIDKMILHEKIVKVIKVIVKIAIKVVVILVFKKNIFALL